MAEAEPQSLRLRRRASEYSDRPDPPAEARAVFSRPGKTRRFVRRVRGTPDRQSPAGGANPSAHSWGNLSRLDNGHAQAKRQRRRLGIARGVWHQTCPRRWRCQLWRKAGEEGRGPGRAHGKGEAERGGAGGEGGGGAEGRREAGGAPPAKLGVRVPRPEQPRRGFPLTRVPPEGDPDRLLGAPDGSVMPSPTLGPRVSPN